MRRAGGGACSAQGGAGHRRLLSLLVRQPRARAAHARDRRGAGARDQRVALVGRRPDLPRVRAPLRDGLRRLPRPGGEALPRRARRDAARPRRARRAAHHALARRHRVGGAGRAAARHALPLGSGRRRDRRQLRGGALGRARLRLARHGRHQQRRRAGARRHAAARQRGHDRPLPGAHADGGREHDRRRRRQHRLDRRRRRAARGAAQRRAPTRGRPATAAAATRRP